MEVTDNPAQSITRRSFLRSSAVALAAGCATAAASGNEIDDKGGYAPFSMGIQSYSLRSYNLDEALANTKRLGLHFWEAIHAHIPETNDPAKIKELLAKLRAADITLSAWGVQGFSADEGKARATFEFARLMGFKVISADPTPDSLPVLDKLLEEYKKSNIVIAIHNHGPGARYDKISSVSAALNGHHPRLGACVDTGHFLRSGEDPVEAVKTFGARTYDVHLKDVKGKTQFTELGYGDLRTVDLLKELLKLKYNGILALEYEEHEKDPLQYIDICLASTRDAIKKANRKP